MKLDVGFAALGALIGAAAVAGLSLGIGVSWILLLVVAITGVAAYVVAAVAAIPLSRTTRFGEAMRGFLLGINAAANTALAIWAYGALFGRTAGLVFGLFLGLINLLAVIGPLSQTEFYQGVLGWLTWLMPMSWLVVSLGLGFLLFSLFLTAVTGGKVGYLRVRAVRLEPKTGTVFVKGGLVANLNPIDTAFNMGNFSFVDQDSRKWHMEHEAGHTLNLAVFGSIFHFVGALDEMVLQRKTKALAERLADSNRTAGSNIPMWT